MSPLLEKYRHKGSLFELVDASKRFDCVVPPGSHPNPSGAGDYSSIVGFMKQLELWQIYMRRLRRAGAMLIPTLNSAAASNPRPD